MAATTGMEAVLNALVAKVKAGIAAKLAAIQAECGDGIALDSPPDDAVTLSTRAEIVSWPHVMVLPDFAEVEYDPGQYMTRQHSVWVVSWCQDSDERVLALKLLRTQRAVCEVLVANRRPAAQGDSSGYSLEWRRDEYGPVFQDTPQGFFMQGVRSRFLVKQSQAI